MFLIARVVLAYLIPTVLGFILLCAVEGERARLRCAERWALSFALGSGLVSFFLFYMGIAGIRFSLFTTSILLWPFLVGGGFLWMWRRRTTVSSRPAEFPERRAVGTRIVIGVLACIIVWKIFWVALDIATVPSYFDDSVSCWNYKAKVYFYGRGIICNERDPDFLGGNLRHYPNGVPLFKTWVSLWAGEWMEWAVNWNTLGFFISLGVVFYAQLRRRSGSAVAFMGTYMLLSVPLLTFHAAFAYCDSVAGFYFLSGMLYLYRWIEQRDDFYGALSALLFAVGLSVKEEMGAVFIAGALPVVILSLAGGKAGWRKLAGKTFAYLAISILPSMPWIIVKAHYGLATGMGANFFRFEFHPEAFALLASYCFDSGNYNILWELFVPAVIVSIPLAVKNDLKYLLIPILLTLVVLLGAFTCTPFFEFLRIGTTINRTMLIVVPLMLYYIVSLVSLGSNLYK
ncbi:MAG: hypothetical protein NTZ78_10880 [Candidatus Aureabacteria bacterium]|nr:hypothetical protein [Candidatus Auribacterota bacterium]